MSKRSGVLTWQEMTAVRERIWRARRQLGGLGKSTYTYVGNNSVRKISFSSWSGWNQDGAWVGYCLSKCEGPVTWVLESVRLGVSDGMGWFSHRH